MASKKLKAHLRQIWAACPEKHRLFARGNPLLNHVHQAVRDHRSKIEQVENWDLLLAQIVSWFVVCTMCFSERVKRTRHYGNRSNPEFGSFLVTLGAIINHAVAIQRLCASGFDIPAKQVLRSMVEYSELLTLFDIKPEMLKEYNEKQDYSDANSFWYKHLSKGKGRKTIEEFFRISEESPLREWQEWWREERLVLGAAAHPSFIASYAAFTSLAEGNITMGYMGLPSVTSIRTLRLTFFSLFQTLLMTHSLFFWEENIPNRFIKFNPGNRWHQTAKKSLPFILDLATWISTNQDEPFLAVPPDPEL